MVSAAEYVASELRRTLQQQNIIEQKNFKHKIFHPKYYITNETSCF
jgi:hypothetical protein